MLVVITLSAYSYRFVEMPFRTGRPAHQLPRRRALVLYPASAALVVAIAGGAWLWTGYQGGEHGDNPPITVAGAPIDTLHGNTEALVRASVNAAKRQAAVPSNLTPDLLDLRDSIADVGDCDYEENVRKLCPHGDGRRRQTVVLIGDSHARAWIPAFNRIIEAGGWKAYYLVKPQCTAAHVTDRLARLRRAVHRLLRLPGLGDRAGRGEAPRPGRGRLVAPGQRRLRRRRAGHVGRGHHPAAARGLRRAVPRAEPHADQVVAAPRRTQVAR